MKNWIISYPRSGNSLTRYIFELITNKPTNGLCGKPNPIDVLQQPLIHKDKTDYCLHKNHDFKGVENEDMVFFLIRNPIEACMRHNEGKRDTDVGAMKRHIDGWMDLLSKYDQHQGNKILFYYEELIKIGDRKSREIYPDPKSGTNTSFHSNKFSGEDLAQLWRYIRDRHPYYFETYLTYYYA